MAERIQIRRDTAANWTNVNPVLANGEMGWETDTGYIKVGDGTTAWNDLAYRIATVSDTAYDATSWNGVTGIAPSKNAVRDKFEALPTIATDTIWATAGDLLQGTGNDAGEVLSKGGALALLRMNAGATAVEWGTGGQIAFPATAVPSADPNTLDDYEEGISEVAFVCGTSGTITVNNALSLLGYIKIGSLVTITGRIGVSAVDSPVGDLIMTGLPFAVGDLSDYGEVAYIGLSYEAVNAVTLGMAGYAGTSATSLLITEISTTTSAAEVAGTDVSIAVGSITGFTNGDWIEIYGMDGYREVAQINAVPAAGAIQVDQLVLAHETGSTVVKLQISEIMKKIINLACSIACVARIIGQSYTDIVGYGLGEFHVQKGEPYTQWREVSVQLRKEWEHLLRAFRPTPAIG